MDLIVGMAHHDRRLIADLGCKIVALFRGLAVMADKDPGIGKKMLHLKSIDILTDVGISMNLMALNHSADVVGGCHQILLEVKNEAL